MLIGSMAVYYDRQRRTCIQVGSDLGSVKYIPLDSTGLKVKEIDEKEFMSIYRPIKDYPVERALTLYAGFVKYVGATDEVLAILGQTINIDEEVIKMARARLVPEDTLPAPAAPAGRGRRATAKPDPVAKPTPAAKATGRAAKATPAAKATGRATGTRSKASTNDYPSAAAMFQGLIMEGKLTDDEIFAAVQERFGLDDNKRAYVAWYRNNLRKKGENPPGPIPVK